MSEELKPDSMESNKVANKIIDLQSIMKATKRLQIYQSS